MAALANALMSTHWQAIERLHKEIEVRLKAEVLKQGFDFDELACIHGPLQAAEMIAQEIDMTAAIRYIITGQIDLCTYVHEGAIYARAELRTGPKAIKGEWAKGECRDARTDKSRR